MAIRKSTRKSGVQPIVPPGAEAGRERAVFKALIKKLAKGGPPPDDPYLRHKKLSADRLVGSPDGNLASRRVAALQIRSAMTPPALAPVPGASNWVQLGPMAIPNGQTYSPARVLVTGRVTAIAIDPTAIDTIFLGTAKGGVWKTTNGGGTWSPMSDNEVSLSIGALTLDPTNPLVVYAGTGEGNMYYLQSFLEQAQDSYYGAGLLKSTNGGATWTRLGAAEFTGTAFFRVAIHPSNANRVWVATSAGLFRTTNGGTTWTQLTNGLPAVTPGTLSGCTDVVLHPTNPDIAFAGFWGASLYTTANATAANPVWTPAGTGLPSISNRVSVAISPSSPPNMIAALAGAVYVSADGGATWSDSGVSLAGVSIEDYSNNLAIDPTTPDIAYLSGYPQLWKLTRDPATGTWSGANIGDGVHPDHHAFAIDPTNHLHVFAGCDGGVFVSGDGGANWSDKINRGFCITQFEFLDQHPTSDAVVFSGTQDNGTEQFRNSPVFNHADDGDGGFVSIDFDDPRNVIHEFFRISPVRSQLGGKFGTFTQSLVPGLAGLSLFYPPFALCSANSQWIAFGTTEISIDKNQGAGGWPTVVPLPGATGFVSAINFASTTLLYCATNLGEVYAVRSPDGGVTWNATAIHTAPFPLRFVWDIAVSPASSSTIVVAVSGFGSGHVWRGVVPAAGAAAWTNVSGAGPTGLPDIPANALTIDPVAPATYYVGTDAGVFRTTDSGATWVDFGPGLPNSAVFDLRLHTPSRLLRVVTHGRGMWERRLDVASMPDVDLFVRDHLMDSGRGPTPEGVPAAFEDPLQHVALGDAQFHWMCADIKVDALLGTPLAYQFPVADVDFVAYEAKLAHRDAQRGNVNRAYVQVHNRGILTASNVTVKLLYANASAGLPPLPADFWTAFPGNSALASAWHPIGAAQTVSVTPTLPAVLEWDWTTPLGQATHSCLLAVVDSPQDPIPAAHKIFDVDALVVSEKRVGLKNLHVVDAPPTAPGASMSSAALLDLAGSARQSHSLELRLKSTSNATIGFFLPKNVAALSARGSSVTVARPSRAQLSAATQTLGRAALASYDTRRLYSVTGRGTSGKTPQFAIPPGGLRLAIVLTGTNDPADVLPRFDVVHRDGGNIAGGSTFVLRPRP